MAAAEDAIPVLHCQRIAPWWYSIVDRRGGAQRYLRGTERHPTPDPPAGQGTNGGHVNGLLEAVLRVEMIALAEEKRVTGAVGDLCQANAAIKGKDAVATQAGIVWRRTP